jgi:hypothetical protein
MDLSSLSIKKTSIRVFFFCFRVVPTAYRVVLINKVVVLERRIMSTTANFGFETWSKSCQHLFVVAMMTILILSLITESQYN